MPIEMAFVLVVTVVAVVLFVTETLPVDVVALGIMAVLLLGGILTPEEGLAGFSNPATVTIGAMLVISASLFKSGALNVLSVWLGLLGRFGNTVLLMTMRWRSRRFALTS